MLNNTKKEYDDDDLFMNNNTDEDATHEYELELISDSPLTMIEPINNNKSPLPSNSNDKLGLSQRALSAAGAALLSAIIVNPLDVVKTRLQAQAAGVAYSHPMTNHTMRMAVFGPNMLFADLRCSPSCTRAGVHGTVSICPPDCFEYKGTLDVFCKIIRQEGVARLWRGTNAGLALAVPTVGIYLPCYDIFRNWFEEFSAQNAPSMTPYAPLLAGSLSRSLACTTCYPIELARTRMQAYKDFNSGKKSPGVWKTLVDVLSSVKTSENMKINVQSYRVLWTGLGAQLARDVPFSAICWSTLEPVRRSQASEFGGFVAGSLAAAAATCPLDVAKTRRQIEKDPFRMTTRAADSNGGLEGWGNEGTIYRSGAACGACRTFGWNRGIIL